MALHVPQVNKSFCGNNTQTASPPTPQEKAAEHFLFNLPALIQVVLLCCFAHPQKIFNTLVWVSAPISASVRLREEIHENVPLANLDRSSIHNLIFLHKFIFAFHSNDIEDCRPEVIWKWKTGAVKAKDLGNLCLPDILLYHPCSLSSQSFLSIWLWNNSQWWLNDRKWYWWIINNKLSLALIYLK